MIRPVMKSSKNWEEVGSFLRPGIRMISHPNWKIFWTPQGYQLISGETTVRYFHYLREAKAYAMACVEQGTAHPA